MPAASLRPDAIRGRGQRGNPIVFFPRQCGELGSQKAAAILVRLRVCRTRMELSPMLRAAHPAGSGASPHLYPAFSGTAQALSRSEAGLPCCFEPRRFGRGTKFATR